MARRETPSGPLTPDDILDLIEAIWLPLDPDQSVEWKQSMRDMDLDLAQEAIIILKDASSVKPSVRLFEATYRGLRASRPRRERVHPGAAWFAEQRAKLRLEESHPES